MKNALLLANLVLAIALNASICRGAEEYRFCPDSKAMVISAGRKDFQDVCTGIRKAVTFFESIGLRRDKPIVVEVTARLPADAGQAAGGCYMEDQNRIIISPYAEFQKQKTWFNVPIDRRLYCSLAAHETAHALAACHFATTHPTIQAKEYVAYVAMFDTMDQPLRERIFTAQPGTGFDNEEQITAVAYMFDPMKFGVNSYRHYIKPENGNGFLISVLAGRVLAADNF